MVVLCALIPGGTARAQGSGGGATSTAWSTSISYLGIENIRCNCTVRAGSDRDRLFIFRSEPVVTGVIPGSAGDGILFRGDTIMTIDGHSLLTAEGARRFATIEPGDDVNLLVKRRGNLLKLSLEASTSGRGRGYTSISPEAPTPSTPEAPPGFSAVWEYPPTTPRPPRPPTAVAPGAVGRGGYSVAVTTPASPAAIAAPAVPPIPPSPAPLGWFGFSIRCTNCGWSTSGEPGALPVWESEETPELSMVSAESPAGRAGFRAGDRITHIDGLSILTTAGARRFGAVRPGQRVRLTVLRNGVSMTRELTLATRPEVRAAIAAAAPRTPPPPSMRRELRYTGQMDNVSVEVWSAGGPTVERVGDTMIITVGASVVRIKVDPKKSR
jgi:hypothetical protein